MYCMYIKMYCNDTYYVDTKREWGSYLDTERSLVTTSFLKDFSLQKKVIPRKEWDYCMAYIVLFF